MLRIPYLLTKSYSILLAILFFSINSSAQKDTIIYHVELSGLSSNSNLAPSLLQNNRYGTVSSDPSSFNTLIGFSKKSNPSKSIFKYTYGLSALTQIGSISTKIYLHEYYAKAKLSVFDLTLGAREEFLGNQDNELSSGGLLFSKNSRPMPKMTIGIENFVPIHFTKDIVEIKGALSHGWFTDNIGVTNAYLHHKYLHLRFGGKLPVHLQYGLDHVAQWGGNSSTEGQQPTSLKDYKNIFFAQSGGSTANPNDQINVLGNHIISQSLRLDVHISEFNIGAYWQNLSEDSPFRPIWNTMNVKDGLWGLSIKNKSFSYISGFLYEYLNTTDQSGPYHDKDGLIYGGADSYFSNYLYPAGWSYYQRTIGTPFIYTHNSSISNNLAFAINNRVQAHHLGIMGEIRGFKYKALSSFSKNYGNYGIPESEMKRNTGLLLDVKKQFLNFGNIELGLAVAADFGKFYGNTFGGQFSIRKTGDLFRY